MKTSDETGAPGIETQEQVAATGAKKQWSTPEITSITSILNTQGISYRIGDGLSNLS